jgi:nucleoside-diphosphate-sugar epimerase
LGIVFIEFYYSSSNALRKFNKMPMMEYMSIQRKNVLVTGGGGYLGSVLVPLLLERGYRVSVLDRFFFGKETLASCAKNKNCKLIEGDTRWFSKDILKSIDAVIDLAALSNDPLAELDPERTLDINFHARVRTAELARMMGVKRYILASSCSVYGNQDEILHEKSPTAPLTTYARTSLLAEQGALQLSNSKFTAVALRQGTLYGVSPRMRFDLVVNAMVLSTLEQGKINVSGGKQWRPIVHVEDSARAFIRVLETSPEKVNGGVFNVGTTEHNFQIENLAAKLAGVLNPKPIITTKSDYEKRSYRVSCDKIKNRLGYLPQKNPEDGAKEVYDALRSGTVSYSIKTKTVEWYKKLLEEDPHILDRKI